MEADLVQLANIAGGALIAGLVGYVSGRIGRRDQARLASASARQLRAEERLEGLLDELIGIAARTRTTIESVIRDRSCTGGRTEVQPQVGDLLAWCESHESWRPSIPRLFELVTKLPSVLSEIEVVMRGMLDKGRLVKTEESSDRLLELHRELADTMTELVTTARQRLHPRLDRLLTD